MKNLGMNIHKKWLLSACVAPILLITAPDAMAQLPAAADRAASGQASPDRVQDQIIDQGIYRSELSNRVQVKNLVLQQMPAGAENIKLTLNGIEFEGMETYEPAELQSVYADKLGQNITLADVYAISTALTNKYRNDGYILSQVKVPPQTIEGGIVKLRVYEGFVDKISVEGDQNGLDTIRGYANEIRNAGTVNAKDLEKFLLLINGLPGVDARAVLSGSQTRVSASDLRIIVERDPYDAFLGVNNYGSRFLGPLQIGFGGTANSFFGQNESITGQVVIAPDRDRVKSVNAEMAFYSLEYKQPINSHGTNASLLYSHSNTEPGFTLQQFDVNGKSDFISAKVEHPFIYSREESLFGSVQFDWRNTHSSNNVEPTREDRVRALRFNGQYQFADSLIGFGVNSLGLTLSQGIDVFGRSSDGDIRVSRPAADPNFTKVNADIQRLQRLTSDINLLAQATGQWSNDALYSSEEFGVGGFALGRGYDPSEVIGDQGIAGKLELQWNQPKAVSYLEDYQLFGFYDIGRVWNADATTTADKRNSIASTGVGARLDITDTTQAGMAIAFPLTREVETSDDRGPRFYFNLNQNF